ARVSAHLESIERVLDASTLASVTGRTSVLRNEVADCVLKLRHPIAFDRAADLAATSRFVLVDNFSISGGGVVREALTGADSHTARARASMSAPLRASVLWLTGERGTGKSAIARWLASSAERAGSRVELLDDDTVEALFPAGGTEAERDLRVRRLAWLASRLEAHGAVVIVAIDSPSEESRRYARSIAGDFVEVHVAATAEVLAGRGAARSEAERYETPIQPELRLDTGHLSVDEAGAEVLAWLEEWSSNS
ncbi:MAG: Adenylyl-sulfate kinase, partial [Gemmatimonadetes bacterium]|nr:Adenylyl-sulfate kinase [Gemmatimonadota bacterium]